MPRDRTDLRALPGGPGRLAGGGPGGLHAVGGAVRDLLRGRVPRELDLVVEGDAVAWRAAAPGREGGAVP